MISKEEYDVLLVLKEYKDYISLEDIAKKLNYDQYKVLRILGFLKEKNLIDLKEEKDKYYSLTDIGKKYLEEGLPEERMINIIKEKKEINLNELRSLFDPKEFNYALGYLKKNGYITIENGVVKYLKDIESNRESLKRINEGNYNEEDIKKFLDRKEILKINEKTKYYAKINEGGLKEIEKGYEDYLGLLTKEIIDKKEYKNKKFRPYAINVEVPLRKIGKYNDYLRFLDNIRIELISLGFKEMEDYSIVLSHFWNFDSLFMPQDHPAGDISIMDAYYLKNIDYIEDYPKDLFEKVKEIHKEYFKIWDDNIAKRAMLISQNTAVSSRTLYKIKQNNIKNGKYFLIDKVFRYDTIDAKHFIEFNQLEGIVIGEDLTFIELLGLLEELTKNIVKVNEVKFYPAFFPFTEPSVEIYAKHEKLGWIEVGGAGVFREELLRPFDIKEPVLAWGIGIDRLYMIYKDINDIRDLHTRNIRKLQD